MMKLAAHISHVEIGNSTMFQRGEFNVGNVCCQLRSYADNYVQLGKLVNMYKLSGLKS